MLLRKKLGEVLIDEGLITFEQMDNALKEQRDSSKRLGEILIEKNYITEKQLIGAMVRQLGIEFRDLREIKIDPHLGSLIPESIARIHILVPISLEGKELILAVADPMDYKAINDIKIYTRLNIRIVIAEKQAILDKIRDLYTSEKAFAAAKELSKNNEEAAATKDVPESIQAIDQPIIRLVNNMIDQAVIQKASDIHIEPINHIMRIRFRVDGHLSVYMETGIDLIAAIIARIKYIGGMNIAEKRIPQDGRITYNSVNQKVDLRISVLPSVFGEKIVIRITSALSMKLDKQSIGFLPENLLKFNQLLKISHGIILLTGPTGSGKTTTLYTALTELDRPDINIVTIENPVEMVLEGITQVEVNPKAGLTFAVALRSILRQDPDVVMVGEIRDEETANIAASVSITGHLILSTLHTYDAPSAIIRLTDMGVEPFMVSSAVAGVISQRLLRKICPKCREAYIASLEDLDYLEMTPDQEVTLYKGKGCEYCNFTGYQGRIAIHEVMPMTAALRRAIHKKLSSEDVRNIALGEGMISLAENAKRIVLDGIISLDEMLKIFSRREL